MAKKKAAVAPKDSSINIGVDAMTCTMSPLIDRNITNRTLRDTLLSGDVTVNLPGALQII